MRVMARRTFHKRLRDMASRARGWVPWIVAAGAIALSPLPLPSAPAQERHVRIEAADDGFSPGVIKANLGDRITVELVAVDVVHGLFLEGYDVTLTADPGQSATISFVADREGTFAFRCSIVCGPLHPFLVGKLRVGANVTLWRALGISLLIASAVVWGVRR
jgi:heme/copper-type cytochrome/quinol oxidase subunit 2